LPYIFSDVPLFYVILGSIIVGLVVAYLINLIPAISQFFQLQGKENEIKKNKNKVLELTKRIHQLELENEKLKHKPDTGSSDSNAL
jgi:cell shape-determining protein MreC